MKNLPIYDVLEDIKTTLKQNNTLIIEAPPGAGKSTIVPISLLDQEWLENKTIIMLEPRRIAARMVATQMAKLLNQKVGQKVGYQVKMEACYSKETKLLVVTEAILVKKLQSDQALENVALIIFDEFHERNIHSDLSLALSLQTQEMLREDLKLLIMSATLNTKELQNLLGTAQVICSKGKSYELENIYLEPNIKQADYKTINSLLLQTTLKVIKEEEGDILVFLAGVKEINKLYDLLKEKLQNIDILPLHGALSKEAQDKAIAKSNKRKIILSTNIAQTSVTIEDIKVVIDSGLEKLSFYDYNTGMNHLVLSFIGNDSAIQRAGRAGRLSKGKCYKLWHKEKILANTSTPEILRTDLSSFILDLALWGVEDTKELKFLDYPNTDTLKSTKTILQELKMLDSKFNITPLGKKALNLGVHPRFAYMILKANSLGYGYEACLLASFLSEKDIFKNSYSDSNIYHRFIHLYEKDIDNSFINKYLAEHVLKQAQFFYIKLKSIENTPKAKSKIDEQLLAVLTIFAYPDRLAKQRAKKDNRYKLSNAKGAILNMEDTLFGEEFLVTPVLNTQIKDSLIKLALKVSLQTIQNYFNDDIKIKNSISYNKENKKFDIKEQHYFYKLQIYSKPISASSEHDFTSLILELIEKEGLELLNWNKKAIDLQNRVNFINNHIKGEFPDFSNDVLLKNVQIWLSPYLDGITSVKQLQELDIYPILLGSIPWEAQQKLDALAPSHMKVPSGSNIKINYNDETTPIFAVKIQELFGMHDTPKILNEKIPLQIHLLSPALRAIQITYDLKSFWDNSYNEVKKELFSKYKKHYWPDNPYEAIATNKTKKNMKK